MNLQHARNVEAAKLRAIQKSVGHYRHQRHPGSSLFLNQPQHECRIESANHHLLDAIQNCCLGAPPAIRMKKWDGMQFDKGIVLRDAARNAQGMQIEGAMRKHYAFRRPSAAAGVKQLRNLVFIEGEYVRPFDAAARQQFLEREIRLRNGIVDCDVPLDAVARPADGIDERREIILENQHAGA